MYLPISSDSSMELDSFMNAVENPKPRYFSARPLQKLSPLILLVEENEAARLMLKNLLNIWNYRVDEAANDEDALRSVEQNHPDLFLISTARFKADELSLIRKIRQPATRKTSIFIFLSTSSDSKIHASADVAGVNDFFIKPINFGRLQMTLEIYLKPPKRRGDIYL